MEEEQAGYPRKALAALRAGASASLEQWLRTKWLQADDRALILLRELMIVGFRTPGMKDEFLERVERVVRAEYPESARSLKYFTAWSDGDKEAASRFLGAEWHPVAIGSELTASVVVAQLAGLARPGNEVARKKLESLPLLPGRAEEERREALASLRPLSEGEIRELASKWRRSRSPDLLARLYYRYIAAIPAKTVKMKDLLRLLGRPDIGDQREARYHPNGGTALFLCADEEGYVGPRSFA